jgi:hypothetical protein
MLAVAQQGHAQIVMSIRIVGRAAHRPAVAGDALGQTAQGTERDARVVVGRGEARVDPDRRLETLQRLLRTAALQRDQPQQVQRLDVVRRPLQRLFAERRGLRETPGLAQLGRLGEELPGVMRHG